MAISWAALENQLDRWWPSDGSLADAGLLIHCLDNSIAESLPIQAPSVLSTSLLFAGQRAVSGGTPASFLVPECLTRGGLILQPGGSTRVLCGSGHDTGAACPTLVSTVPVGGEPGPDYPGDGCGGCSWGPPAIHVYLRRVTAWQQKSRRAFYNEFTVDGHAWFTHLPTSIEAVFGEGGRMVAGAMVARFGRAAEPLIVSLDASDWERPLFVEG